MMKVYALLSYDLLEYIPAARLDEIYTSREKAEQVCAELNANEQASEMPYYDYEVKEYEVIE